MNWNVKGKFGGKRPGGLKVISGADTEGEVIEALKGSHPEFVVESVTPMDAKPVEVEKAPEPTKAK